MGGNKEAMYLSGALDVLGMPAYEGGVLCVVGHVWKLLA